MNFLLMMFFREDRDAAVSAVQQFSSLLSQARHTAESFYSIESY